VWISVEEQKWNEYNVAARKLRGKFEELLKGRKWMDAYAVFAEMETTGGAGVDFPPVVEAMKKAMSTLEGSIAQAIERYPLLTEERKQLLGQQTPEKKVQMTAVIKKEQDDFRKLSAAEKKNKVRVPTYYAYDLKSIQASLDAAKKEAAYLQSLDMPGLILANRRFEQGLKDMHAKAFLSAKNNFEAAARFHSKDPVVKKKVEEATKAIEAAKQKPGGR
jgi:hypothetical protein